MKEYHTSVLIVVRNKRLVDALVWDNDKVSRWLTELLCTGGLILPEDEVLEVHHIKTEEVDPQIY